jgi:hypothetical protein
MPSGRTAFAQLLRGGLASPPRKETDLEKKDQQQNYDDQKEYATTDIHLSASLHVKFAGYRYPHTPEK